MYAILQYFHQMRNQNQSQYNFEFVYHFFKSSQCMPLFSFKNSSRLCSSLHVLVSILWSTVPATSTTFLLSSSMSLTGSWKTRSFTNPQKRNQVVWCQDFWLAKVSVHLYLSIELGSVYQVTVVLLVQEVKPSGVSNIKTILSVYRTR